MIGVLFSRFLSFFREWSVAHLMGSSGTTDAYYAAFMLPDFLNYLLSGGALEAIFLPVFTMYLAAEKTEEGWHVFSTVATFLGGLLIALIILGEIYAPGLVRIISPGFAPEQKAEVVRLTRIMLPAQFFLCIGVVLNAVQNAYARFAMPVAGVLIANLGVILGGWFLSPRFGITGFAVGLLVGSVFGYFLLQVIAVARLGCVFRLSFDFSHPGFRLFLRLAIPIMLALSIVVTDEWLLRWFGSYLPAGSISWLTYGKNLMRVPLAVVGHAVGVATFPFLSQLYAQGKLEELNRLLNSAAKGLLLLLIPISALSAALAEPLVYLVFSRTRMSPGDLHATASVFVMFSVGMAAWGLQNLLSRGFYSLRDMVTPAVVGTLFTLLNLPIYWYLARHWQARGLAAASSWSVVGYTATVFVLLARKTQNHRSNEVLRFSLKLVAATVPPAIVAHYLASSLERVMPLQNTFGALGVLVIIAAVGIGLIYLLARLLRVRELESWLRKRSGSLIDSPAES